MNVYYLIGNITISGLNGYGLKIEQGMFLEINLFLLE
jgi:hypothetical protein